MLRGCFRMLGATVLSALVLVGCGGEDNPGNSGGHTHSYGSWMVGTAATCDAAGVERRSCSCGASETREIARLSGTQCGGGGGGGNNGVKGSFTDSRNGQSYKTVTIGGKTWMAENLNYNASGSVCYNNEPSNCSTYGRLYNWETAKSACPAGWHLPSDDEWQTFVDYVGGYSTAGRKLKATEGWYGCGPANSGKSYVCEDAYGFSALPGGHGYSDGSFRNAGNNGFWWSATESGANYAWLRFMYYDEEHVGRYDGDKTRLLAARCVKDVRQ